MAKVVRLSRLSFCCPTPAFIRRFSTNQIPEWTGRLLAPDAFATKLPVSPFGFFSPSTVNISQMLSDEMDTITKSLPAYARPFKEPVDSFNMYSNCVIVY